MIINLVKLSQSNNMLNVKVFLIIDFIFCNNYWDVGRLYGYIVG